MKDTNEYHSPDQDLVVQALRSVKRSILVLDHFTDEGVRPDVEMNAQAMKWRLDTLVERARDGVTYRRFCQVSDTSKPLDAARIHAALNGKYFLALAHFVIDRVRNRILSNVDVRGLLFSQLTNACRFGSVGARRDPSSRGGPSQPRLCPACGRSFERVHSLYGRRLCDTAIKVREVTIDVQVRRFRCVNPGCDRRVFAEPLPGLAYRYARRRCWPGSC